MRINVSIVVSALLACASGAAAQVPTPPSFDLLRGAKGRTVFGQIDFGGRMTTVDGDPARYQRYRDQRDGAFFDLPYYHRETDTWWTTVTARNVGYRDQRYTLTFARPGKMKVDVMYDRTPTFISADTRTPYSPRPGDNGLYSAPGAALTLPDAVQSTIQADRSLVRPQIEALATAFDTRTRRDTFAVDLQLNLTDAWLTRLSYKNIKRQGSLPWGASFGFNLPIEVALPIDTRTDDLGASLEWNHDKGMFRMGYNGSWFDQRVPTYTWDNPLRITDQTYSSAYSAGDGTSRGLGTQWPSNSFYYVNFAGAYRPARRVNLNATLSLGQASQNEPLVPYTINTAIAPLNQLSSLDRLTAEAKANIGAATVNLVARPSRIFNVTTRYRFARYDNKTPHFNRSHYVRFDQVEEEGGPPRFQGYTRNNVDVDGTYTGVRYLSFRVGYGYAGSDFAERVYFENHENTVRASVDAIGNQYVTLRSTIERSQRRGSGFHAAVLEHAEEQPGMRHYDVADRDRTRISLITNVFPTGDLGVNALIAWTDDTYLNPEQPQNNSFGLLNYRSQTYGVGFDYLPGDLLGVGASYNFDKYDGLSQSRNARPAPDPQFFDPDRNWTTDENQKGHSFLTYLELPEIAPRTEARVDYDYSRYRGLYLYATGPGYQPSPSEPGGVAQLPVLTSEEHRVSVDLRHFIRPDLAIGFAYWFDNYEVTDFTLGPPGESFVEGVARPPIFEDQPADSAINGVVLNYFYRPYTAHTAWVRLTYLW